jgi:N-acetylneuraminic acid mutarotase
MAAGRIFHTATRLADGSVLVAGGVTGSGPELPDFAELYDPATGSWTAAGTFVTPRRSHTATLLTDGKVMVAGGFGMLDAMASADVYDPAARSWTPIAAMNEARSGHTATLLTDGEVLVAGGSASSAASAQLFDPGAGD